MTDEAKPTLLDAVSAAVAEATPTPAEPTNDDLPTGDVDTTDTGAGDDPGAGDDGAATGDGAVAGEGDGDGEHQDDSDVDEKDPAAVEAAEKAGRKRGADGKFVKRTAAEKKADAEAAAAEANKGKTPEQIEADAKAAKAVADATKKGKKEPDAVNDPIPANVKAETRARITKLISTVKDVEAKEAKVSGDLNFVMDRIRESTATPEQYTEVLGVVRLINSNNPDDQRRALQYLQNSAATLAKRLGVVLPGVDILSAHADLKREVDMGHISRARAEELAAARDRNTVENTTRTQTAEQQRAQAERTAAVEAGRADLNALETELRAADSTYDARRDALIKMLQPALNAMHPSKWKAAFKTAYDNMPKAAPPRPAPKPNTGTNQPMRANKTPAGGQGRAPSSMLEAISAAVAKAG